MFPGVVVVGLQKVTQGEGGLNGFINPGAAAPGPWPGLSRHPPGLQAEWGNPRLFQMPSTASDWLSV